MISSLDTEFLSILRMAVVSEDPDDDETRFRKAFRSFDKDSNGFLDVKELHHVLNMLDSKYSDEEVSGSALVVLF